MRSRTFLQSLAGGACLLGLGVIPAAQAQIVDIFSYGTSGTPPNGHQWQLNVTVTNNLTNNLALFTFSKINGGRGYGLTDIYFEQGLSSLLSNPSISINTTGNQDVVFAGLGTGMFGMPDEDPLVPGSSNPWDGNLAQFFSVEAGSASAQDNSLNRKNEAVIISWNYSGTQDGLIAALLNGAGDQRIAVRVNQNRDNGTCPDASCGLSTVNPVPLPPAAWLLGSSLLGLVSIARRKSLRSNA